MVKTIGKVIEVFIPKQYKNGNLLDVMDRTNIGFKIITEDGMREIIVESDEYNAKIMKNDLVVVKEQINSDNNFISIQLYGGEENDR